jgi:ATP-dependent helicase/nuclease subunit A
MYEEIGALSLLSSCLNYPGDRISQLAVLKGMLFVVSDNALSHYKMQGFPIVYTYLPNQAEVSETALPVYEALELHAGYARIIRKMPALSALIHIIENLGLIKFVAVRPTGRHAPAH